MQKVLAKLQKLGKALMLPIACLPVAGILMGIGYMIDSNVMSGLGDPNVIAFFLVKVGGRSLTTCPFCSRSVLRLVSATITKVHPRWPAWFPG